MFFASIEIVSGKLVFQELVVGQIVVETVDDPLAVFVGVGIKELGIVTDLVRLVFSVAGEREPEARHAFAESSRVDETLDEEAIGFGTFVGEEGVDLGGSGRKAGEIESEAADENAARGGIGGREFGAFELCEDEIID